MLGKMGIPCLSGISLCFQNVSLSFKISEYYAQTVTVVGKLFQLQQQHSASILV